MVDDDVTAYNKGIQLLSAGKVEEAIPLLKTAAETGLDRPQEHYALAQALEKAGQDEFALAEYRRFLEMSGDADNAYTKATRQIVQKLEKKLAPAPKNWRSSTRSGKLSLRCLIWTFCCARLWTRSKNALDTILLGFCWSRGRNWSGQNKTASST